MSGFEISGDAFTDLVIDIIADEFQKYDLFSVEICLYLDSLGRINVIRSHLQDHYLNFVLVQNKRNIFYQQPL